MTTTKETTRNLRGKPVIHTRTIHHRDVKQKPHQQLQHEQLVDPNVPHHAIKMRGTGHHGQSREFTIDVDVLTKIGREQLLHHHAKDDHELGHRIDNQFTHLEDHRFEGHEQSLVTPNSNQPQQAPSNQYDSSPMEMAKSRKQQEERKKRRNVKENITLPTGLDEHYNHSLYEVLHNAPFEIYERIFGNPVEGRMSFPVFLVPQWKNSTGVFSGFSRTATPLVFENMQFLLTWENIVHASSGANDDLINFMNENNFHSSLLIGKAISQDSSHTPFLGLMVSYYQNTDKNILVPFATLDNFFHDTSEKHLLSESTKHLEHEALHEMLDDERMGNSTNPFLHSSLSINHHHKEELADLEAAHFRRLFQLLIRRSFLFSYGYADCLKTEPHTLRDCLDDTFSIVVKMETAVRGALDEMLIEELAEITERLYSKVSEACISVSGVGSTIYGAGRCDTYMGGDLGAFVIHHASPFR